MATTLHLLQGKDFITITSDTMIPELAGRIRKLMANFQQEDHVEYQVSAKQNVEKGSSPSSNRDDKFLKKVDDWIINSLPDRKPDVAGLANEVHISSRQLRRRIKSLTGLSTARYIKEIQLQAAREALDSDSSLSISEIGFKFGFEHPSTFSNVFKKRYGQSPRKYLFEQNKKPHF